MARVDITIFGAGIFGLSVAWEAVQRGAKVRVVDPHGVGAGASGGVVGALAPHVPENWNEKKAFQFESLIMAAPWWAQVREVSGLEPHYQRTGRLQPLPEGAMELAQKRGVQAESLWEGKAQWRVVETDDRPWAPISASGYWIEDTLSAHLHPASACAALAAACVARGVEIVDDAYPEGAVVWANGAVGLEQISAKYGRSIGQGIKGQAAVLRLAVPHAPQLFADALHIMPHGNGTVAIGSTTERDATDLQCDNQLEDLVAKARRLVPALRDAPVVQRWAGWRPRARSRAPVLGALPAEFAPINTPASAQHFIANGGFKIGFGMAPKAAVVLADLILEGQDSIPDSFRFEALLPKG